MTVQTKPTPSKHRTAKSDRYFRGGFLPLATPLAKVWALSE